MMKIKILLLMVSCSLLATDGAWTQETKSMGQIKSDKVIQAYTKGKELPLNLEFKDDATPQERLGLIENLLVFGLELGSAATTDTVSNTQGSKSDSYSTSHVKLILGKDFTMWHEDYTEPTRFYLAYAYNLLGTELTTSTFSFGVRENMSYWPLYETENFAIFPTLSYELGQSYIKRADISARGFTSEASGGVTYKRGNFEYFVNFTYSKTDWNYPVDGIAEVANAYGMSFGLNYTLMYGDI